VAGILKIHAAGFWLPKAGNKFAEYEDAFSPRYSGYRQSDVHCFAVGDGATEGMLSGKWAEIVVKRFYRSAKTGEGLEIMLARAYEAWEASVRNYLAYREARQEPVAWYEQNGLQTGAFTSLVGLVIKKIANGSCGRWEGVAIGDSCLFLVRRQSKLIASFPIGNPADFQKRPLLISSNPANNQGILQYMAKTEGDCQQNDIFYLMTDALASWFLKEYSRDEKPWLVLDKFSGRAGRAAFKEWIVESRGKKLIRNDDVTLVRVAVCPGEER
jgi:hypothetical protein